MDFLDFFAGIREARSGLHARSEVIETIAKKRLEFIIDEAYRRVPYYANMFRSNGISSHDVRSFDDLRKLPILNKRDVQENYLRLINQDLRPDQCFRKSTSGSTGEPVDCLHDVKGWYRSEGIALRGQIQGGLKMEHKAALVVPPPSMGRNRFYRILSKLGRLKYLSVLDDVDVTLRSLRSFKPHVLKTYPSFLRAAIETGSVPSCELIFSMSELLEPNLRKGIEASFNARVIDLYGAVEFTSIAWECAMGAHFHLDADAVFVEGLKFDSDLPANPGEPARIIVTGLMNRAMPLIRYDLGDVGIFSQDECESHVELPILKRIEGRSVDCIRLPSGRLISPYVCTEWVHEITKVRHFQIIQVERNRIIAKLVPQNGFDKSILPEWANRLSKIVNEHIIVETQIVDSIESERPGKYNYVISKVK